MLIMQLQNGQSLDLIDAQQRLIGHVAVEGNEGELVEGTFVPGPAFADVEPLFRAFEEAANSQALRVVEDLAARLAALGLALRSPDARRIDIHDVQIWGDGGISFRLSAPTA